jgi:Rad3-related DNA helicase
MSFENMTWEPLEIEELKREAEKHNFCPYYANKDRAHAADIILMPYNYLIDDKIRRNLNIKWHNSIIIVDEAHNIA